MLTLNPTNYYDTVRNIPRDASDIADHYNLLGLVEGTRRFLYDQLNAGAEIRGDRVDVNQCPLFRGKLKVFKLAAAIYYAPSDQSGKGGLHRDIIRCTRSWRGGPAQYDSVFVDNGGAITDPLGGLLIARVLLFFSFRYQGKEYSCAFVEWFLPAAEEPDETTGMWIVAPEVDRNGRRVRAVISLDTILRGAHLIGVYGDNFLPVEFTFGDTLNAFNAYYVNKYIDHHSHTIC